MDGKSASVPGMYEPCMNIYKHSEPYFNYKL